METLWLSVVVDRLLTRFLQQIPTSPLPRQQPGAMYYDLFVPFPVPDAPATTKKSKGKAKAAPVEAGPAPTDCWAGLSSTERAEVARTVALEGHCGY